jgi:hypothetical protein
MPTKKTKIIFLTVLSLVVLASVCFVLMYISMNSLIANSAIKEDQIKTKIQTVDSKSLMKKDLEINSEKIAKLSDFVVGSGNTVDFIKSLENITAQNNLKINIKNAVSKASTSDKLELLNITLEVTGEWKNVEYFLELLENYPLKISINNISISKSSDIKVNGKIVPQWIGSYDFSVVKLK